MRQRKRQCGAEEARTHLPELLERAHHGISTVITKHGKAYAALVPATGMEPGGRAIALMSLKGSGAGLWAKDSASTVAAMRDEWE
jgi:prevent-host-death family protein